MTKIIRGCFVVPLVKIELFKKPRDDQIRPLKSKGHKLRGILSCFRERILCYLNGWTVPKDQDVNFSKCINMRSNRTSMNKVS